jgi:hypothetical protein
VTIQRIQQGFNNGGAATTVVFTTAQQLGDMITVAIFTNVVTAALTSPPTDTSKNVYNLRIGPISQAAFGTAWIYDSFNIKKANASANTISVTMTGATQLDVFPVEYHSTSGGLWTIDNTKSNSGNGANATTGAMSTKGNNDAIFAMCAGNSSSGTLNGSAVFVELNNDGAVGVDMDALNIAPGSYTASVSQTAGDNFVAVMAAYMLTGAIRARTPLPLGI